MTLLRKIQTEAAGDDVPVSVILRHCQILAARLGNQDFATWVDRELNGYPAGVELPDYRAQFDVEVRTNLSGPYGSGATSIPVGRASVKPEHEDILFTASFTEGVSQFEELLKSEGDTFNIPWQADAVSLYGDKVFENMVMIGTWQVVGRGRVRGLLDSIRSKVLAFALKIEEENPEAGEAVIGSEPVEEATVSNIVNNHIYGDGANVASGSGGIVQHATHNFVQGDFNGLRLELEQKGVPADLIDVLEGVVVSGQDGHALDSEREGKLQQWVGQLAEGVASKSITLAAGASVDSVIRAVHHFLGI